MKYSPIRRGLFGVMGLLLASTSLVAVVATAAHADTWTDPGSGFVKICKTFTPTVGAGFNQAAPVFTFSISGVVGDPTGLISVTAGSCSLPISVPAGTQTVTETSAPWYKVASITELDGQSYLVGTPNLSTGSAQVVVANSASVDELDYTNDAVNGYVEVCKTAATGSNLSGSYAFTLKGADSFSTSTSVAIVGSNNCSDPILVPAGTVTVTEGGTNLYVTGITAQTNGIGASDIVGVPDLINGTVTATVAASADASTQTDISYTDDVVAFEVCKNWNSDTTEPGGSGTLFPFTLTASGPAGPNTVPASVSIAASQCSTPVSLRPGTAVTVTEGIVPGTKVESISASGADSISTPASITNRSITVLVGTPITSASAPTNDAIVTYVDEAAAPGTLKICKFAGTGAPNGTSFNFTVSGNPGVTTTVGLGQCAFVDAPNGSTALFPYNSTQTITESASTGNSASVITVMPMYVTEIVGTTPTLTSELVEPTAPNLGGTDTTSSVGVVIGENTLTEADFTDIDPPATDGPPVTVSLPGDIGTTSAPTLTAALTVANSSSVTAAAPKLSAAEVRALLKHDKSLLKTVNAKIASAKQKVAHTKGAAHRAALKKLASLESRRNALKKDIRNL